MEVLLENGIYIFVDKDRLCGEYYRAFSLTLRVPISCSIFKKRVSLQRRHGYLQHFLYSSTFIRSIQYGAQALINEFNRPEFT